MDQANTLQIPRIVVDENDGRPGEEETTLVVPVPGSAEANVPAIAQEAPTGVVDSPPGIRSRQRRIDDARARNVAARKQAPGAEPKREPEDEPPSGSLSDRLEG